MDVRVHSVYLIRLIKERPCLWDRTHAEYKFKIPTAAAWKEVYTLLRPDFESMTFLDQVNFRQEVKRRWRNVKDNFIKCVRVNKQISDEQKGMTFPKKRRKYAFYDSLSFLNKIYNPEEYNYNSIRNSNSYFDESNRKNRSIEEDSSQNNKHGDSDENQEHIGEDGEENQEVIGEDGDENQELIEDGDENQEQIEDGNKSQEQIDEDSDEYQVQIYEESDENQADIDGDSNQESNIVSTNTFPQIIKLKSKTNENRKYGLGLPHIRQPSVSTFMQPVRVARKRKHDEIEIKLMNAIEKFENVNTHVSFINSLLPTLNTLSPKQTLNFQFGVIKLLKDISESETSGRPSISSD